MNTGSKDEKKLIRDFSSYLESKTVWMDVSPVCPCFTSKPPLNLKKYKKTH